MNELRFINYEKKKDHWRKKEKKKDFRKEKKKLNKGTKKI